MTLGIPKEIKRHEYRVAATPACVAAYCRQGTAVIVEKGAGEGAGFSDEAYREAGARIANSAEEVFGEASMIAKVKEPLPPEIPLFCPGQLLYTYLHLASDKALTEGLLARGITAVAYETIQTADGKLPCLEPMSQIAGRFAVQAGARYLERPIGGRGILLGGIPGVSRGRVMILGGGTAGMHAAEIALGMGAQVKILDISWSRLDYLAQRFGGRLQTLHSSPAILDQLLPETDLLIGSVLVPGAAAPKLIKRHHLQAMPRGSVFVDISIDQGGCSETSRPTTHDDPVYIDEEVIHYCVANIPGAVALTSTLGLTGRTLPYGLHLAAHGLEASLQRFPELRPGVNIRNGQLTHPGVASAHNLPLHT